MAELIRVGFGRIFVPIEGGSYQYKRFDGDRREWIQGFKYAKQNLPLVAKKKLAAAGCEIRM